MIDLSDDSTLYIAIGAGALIVLLLCCCCCCCCKRRKNQARKNAEPETPPLAALPPRARTPHARTMPPPRGSSHKPPNQKLHYTMDIDDPIQYRMMPTSPDVGPPGGGGGAATVLDHPPRAYYNYHKTAVFDAPKVGASPSPLVATAPNSLDAATPPQPAFHSAASSRTSQPSTYPMAIAEDAAIVASRLPFDTITALVLISKGGFGEVHKGAYRGNIVAIKRLLPETRRDLKQIHSFFQEVKLMAAMEHPHIVSFIGVAWDSFSDLSVVTEFMEGGDLRAALCEFDRVGRPLGFDKQKATIALHVAHALTYMHSLQPVVLHRDLKSKNVLLDAPQTTAKLTDFGVSRVRSDSTMTAGVGTLLWMAPEVMAGERYDDKADVFSFGILLSELDTYYLPYADVKARLAEEGGRSIPDTALVQRIMTGRVKVTFSPALRSDVRALGDACIALDPTARPTAAQVLYELQKIERTMASEISIVL